MELTRQSLDSIICLRTNDHGLRFSKFDSFYLESLKYIINYRRNSICRYKRL